MKKLLAALILAHAFVFNAKSSPPNELDVGVLSEEIAKSIDIMLARKLIDPASVLDYSVSGLVRCRDVVSPVIWENTDWPTIVQQDMLYCSCYTMNAKDGSGQYSGKYFYAALITHLDDRYYAVDYFPVVEAWRQQVCTEAGMMERNSALILQRD